MNLKSYLLNLFIPLRILTVSFRFIFNVHATPFNKRSGILNIIKVDRMVLSLITIRKTDSSPYSSSFTRLYS